MPTKRPSVTIQSELIQKYQSSDFDKVSQLDSRIAAIEAILGQIPNLDGLIALVPEVIALLEGDVFVEAPLLDNPVNYTAEGFPDEDTLGAILAAFALLTKINEADIAAQGAPIIAAASAVGTVYDPLAGGWDAGLVNVKLVLDSLRNLFPQTGTIVLADDATQTSAFVYANPAVANLPNDGAGPDSDTTYSLPGVTSFYDVLSNQFEFSAFNLGDILTLRLDLDIAPSVLEQEIDLLLSIGEGSVAAKTKLISRQYFKNAVSHNVTAEITFTLDDALLLANPGHVQIQSAANASVVVNTFELFMNIKN
jgi:hypothetical protein